MAKVLSVLSFFFLLLGLSFAEFPIRTRDVDPRRQGVCQLSSINAQEPTRTIQAEGGFTEFWEINNEQFQCAGVSMHRHRIQRRSLLLPHYNNAPVLVFETSQQVEAGFEGERGQKFMDRHQRLDQFRQGDIIAVPAGAAHWAYNNGDQELVLVVLLDVSNNQNQLDRFPRVLFKILQSFFLAGNPERGQQKQQYYGGQQPGGRRAGQHENGNVFRGFNVRTLADAFGVDEQTARSLQAETDDRGHIIIIEKSLQVIRPPFSRQEEQSRQGPGGERIYFGGDNGLEETICSARTRENLDRPTRSDLYNPQAGRFSTANSFTFPILRFLKLSASRGILYRNAIMAPQWYVNSHSMHYITRGECRMEIVNHRGQAVFDGQVRQGQVVVVPQFYGVVKQAQEQGCEWVAFNTNDNAMINNLSGRISAIRALPTDVVANAYQVSREQAERLKFSRQETTLFRGRATSERERV